MLQATVAAIREARVEHPEAHNHPAHAGPETGGFSASQSSFGTSLGLYTAPNVEDSTVARAHQPSEVAESWEGVLREFGIGDGADRAMQESPRRARSKRRDNVQEPLMKSGGSVSSSAGAKPRVDGYEDFASLAAASDEDFEAFLGQLRAQAGIPTGTGPAVAAAPAPSGPRISTKDRAREGSPLLRGAASAMLQPPLSVRSRPGSGNSIASGGSAATPSLKELRDQRRKPRTAEDMPPHMSDLSPGAASAVPIAQGGPGIGLHATYGASNYLPSQAPGAAQSPTLEALRHDRPPSNGPPNKWSLVN